MANVAEATKKVVAQYIGTINILNLQIIITNDNRFAAMEKQLVKANNALGNKSKEKKVKGIGTNQEYE